MPYPISKSSARWWQNLLRIYVTMIPVHTLHSISKRSIGRMLERVVLSSFLEWGTK